MFQETDFPLLPYHCLIRFLKPGIYSKSYFQILFSEIFNSRIFDVVSRNQQIRVVNYVEIGVMREQILCMTCEEKWSSSHKCENSCVVFFNPFDRVDETFEEEDEKVEEKRVVLANDEKSFDQIDEGEDQVLEEIGYIMADVNSACEKAGSVDELQSLDKKSSFDQMLEGESENIEVSIHEGFDGCDDKLEGDLEQDYISRKSSKTGSIESFKQKEVTSLVNSLPFDLVKNNEKNLEFQNGLVGAGLELVDNFFGFVNGYKGKEVYARVYICAKDLDYIKILKRVIRKNISRCCIKKDSRKMQRLQFDRGKNLNVGKKNAIFFFTYFSYFRGFVITPRKSDCKALVSSSRDGSEILNGGEIEEKVPSGSIVKFHVEEEQIILLLEFCDAKRTISELMVFYIQSNEHEPSLPGHGDAEDRIISTPLSALDNHERAFVTCGTIKDPFLLQKIKGFQGISVKMVATGVENLVAMIEDNDLYGWGWGRYENLGLGDRNDCLVPQEVSSIEGEEMVLVACGWRHAIAFYPNGGVYACGWSNYGHLGRGDFEDHLIPIERYVVLPDDNVKGVYEGFIGAAVVIKRNSNGYVLVAPNCVLHPCPISFFFGDTNRKLMLMTSFLPFRIFSIPFDLTSSCNGSEKSCCWKEVLWKVHSFLFDPGGLDTLLKSVHNKSGNLNIIKIKRTRPHQIRGCGYFIGTLLYDPEMVFFMSPNMVIVL